MKLDDFEYYVEEKVLERGQRLFDDGAVRLKDRVGANWYFYVKGTKLYDIEICVNKNNVVMFEDCDCPYFQRALCKHVVACLLYIRKELNIQKETMLSKFLKKNPEIIDTKTIIKKFMQSVFRRIRKGGFIEYDKMVEFEIAIDELIKFIKNKNNGENISEITDSLFDMINIISSTKYNCDDSNGEIVRSFYTVLGYLQETLIKPNHKIYKIIYDNLLNPKNEYDFEQEEIIRLCCKIAETDIDKQQIKKYLTNLIETQEFTDGLEKIKKEFFDK